MKTSRAPEKTSGSMNRPSASFLLAQVGAHAASQFAGRLRKLKLAPQHAGILRILNSKPGMTQQALATTLGMVPSRLVVLLDEMEKRSLVERRADAKDRRRYALHLAEKGRSTLDAIGLIAREHSQALLAAISQDEQQQLALILQRIADQQGLSRLIHPGYRRLDTANGGGRERRGGSVAGR
jgi:DNA-binding MarR family transcriptional regulator